MRTLRLIEHVSLDGLIQHSADDGAFPYNDWTAPYRISAGCFALVSTAAMPSGVILGTYKAAGSLTTG